MSKTVQYHLRKMNNCDLDLVLEWRNHPEVRIFMFNKHEIERKEHYEWFSNNSSRLDKCLLIFEVNKEPSGFIQFQLLDKKNTACWGFYTSPSSSKGTGRQLGILALRYAFDQLGLDNVCGQALSLNKKSIEFHLNLGFSEEPISDDHSVPEEFVENVRCFRLKKSCWEALE